MAIEFDGRKCLLPIWLSLVLSATVLSDSAKSRSSLSPPPPAPPTRTSSTIDPPPWHLLEPPLGHINQGLSGSEAAAARENGKAGDTEDRGAAKTEFNAVR